MRRPSRGVLALTAAVAFVGCGEGEDDEVREADPSDPKAAYIEQADAICAAATERMAPLAERAETTSAEEDLKDRHQRDQGTASHLPGVVERVERLPRPPGDESELDRVFHVTTRGLDAGEDVIDVLLRTADADAVSGRFEAANAFGAMADGLAAEYGFKECGQLPDDG